MQNYVQIALLYSKEFLFQLFSPKGRYFRLVSAFFVAMFFKILIMDFDFFSKAILESNITHQFSLLLVSVTKVFFELINIPVQTNSRNLALYDSIGVLVDSTCLGYRGIILFSFFILAYKGKILSKLVYISLGIIVLEGGNLLRIILLAYIQYCCPEKFDIFHFYLAKIIFYPLILILWIIWIEKISTFKLS